MRSLFNDGKIRTEHTFSFLNPRRRFIVVCKLHILITLYRNDLDDRYDDSKSGCNPPTIAYHGLRSGNMHMSVT